MSHWLDDTYGYSNSMIYVGATPWHKLGTQVEKGLTVAQALEACPAVNFETELRDLHYVSSNGWQTRDADGYKAIVRSDTEDVLGMVTDRYQPIQTRDQLALLDPFIENGMGHIETLGSLQGGKRIWGLFNFEGIREQPFWKELVEFLNDDILPYGMFYDVKTGKGKAWIFNTTIRVVCHNTLTAALSRMANAVGIIHKGDTKAKLEEAANELWGEMIEGYKRFADEAKLLKSTKLLSPEFGMLVLDKIATVPNDPAMYDTDNRFQAAVNKAQSKRDEAYRLWFEGKGHTEDASMWEAYNGVVQMLDHNEYGVLNNAKPDSKLGSLMDGPHAHLKANIYTGLLEYAQAA